MSQPAHQPEDWAVRSGGSSSSQVFRTCRLWVRSLLQRQENHHVKSEKKRVPETRIQIADVVAFLISPAAVAISGAVIPVSGRV